jgi:ankyrin repeat protein
MNRTPLLLLLTLLTVQSTAIGQSIQATDALKAINSGDVAGALRLIDGVNNVNADNGVLLYQSVLQRQTEVVEKLLARGADPSLRRELLLVTVLNRWDSIALLLLRYGADPNNANPHGGLSALSEAAFQENSAVMEALLKRGADVNYNDYVGSGTPLLIAIDRKNYKAAQMLLEHGADASIDAKFIGYPWDLARENKDTRMLDLLIQFRANCKKEPERCR